MRAATLRLIACASPPLILAGSVTAGFTGISTTAKPNVYQVFTVNVYAEFDRPGEDHMLAVAGTPSNPLTVSVIGGTFYQNPVGTDRPPLDFIPISLPSLLFDTFVTIGVKVWGPLPNEQPLDNMALTNFPGFGESVLSITDGSWSVTAADPQGDPFNGDFVAGDGRVLIGQFSTLDGTGFEGTMLLQYVSNGSPGQSVVSFAHVPGPAAWLVLATAGLLGRRPGSGRRRAPGSGAL